MSTQSSESVHLSPVATEPDANGETKEWISDVSDAEDDGEGEHEYDEPARESARWNCWTSNNVFPTPTCAEIGAAIGSEIGAAIGVATDESELGDEDAKCSPLDYEDERERAVMSVDKRLTAKSKGWALVRAKSCRWTVAKSKAKPFVGDSAGHCNKRKRVNSTDAGNSSSISTDVEILKEPLNIDRLEQQLLAALPGMKMPSGDVEKSKSEQAMEKFGHCGAHVRVAVAPLRVSGFKNLGKCGIEHLQDAQRVYRARAFHGDDWPEINEEMTGKIMKKWGWIFPRAYSLYEKCARHQRQWEVMLTEFKRQSLRIKKLLKENPSCVDADVKQIILDAT